MNKTIPIINFKPFLDGNAMEKEAVAQKIYDALDKIGCLYLKNYGFSPKLVEQAFAQSQAFFALPSEEKQKIAMDKMNPGYEKAQISVNDYYKEWNTKNHNTYK